VQVVFVDAAGAKQSGALEVLWSTGFEHVSPVRSFGSFQGQRSSRVRGGSRRRASMSASSRGWNVLLTELTEVGVLLLSRRYVADGNQ
jgi:hypothetical protein